VCKKRAAWSGCARRAVIGSRYRRHFAALLGGQAPNCSLLGPAATLNVARQRCVVAVPCKPSGILVSEDGVELDVDQLTDSMSMAFPGRQQRFRFLERFRLHPPFLGARHQHRGVKNL
jgi:hypothetical protein